MEPQRRKGRKQYRRMNDFLDSTPHFVGTDVDFMNDAALRYSTAQGMPKREMEGEILGLLRRRRSFFGIVHDMMKLLRGMRG